MKSFLFLCILLASVGAFFEYQLEQTHAAAYVQQLADLTARQAQLTADNQKLAEQNDGLNKTLATAEGQASDLSTKISAGPATPAAPPAPATAPTAGSH
jgi:cell division protein FtsB